MTIDWYQTFQSHIHIYLPTPLAVSFLFLLATGAMTLLIWSFLFGILVAVTHMTFKYRSPGHRNFINEETNMSNIGKIVSTLTFRHLMFCLLSLSPVSHISFFYLLT